MKRSRDISWVYKGMSISIILSVFIVLIVLKVGVSIPNRVYGWGSDYTYSVHYFIIDKIDKAIEYLRKPEINLLPDWSLEKYANDIKYGAYCADNPFNPRGTKCVWGAIPFGLGEGVYAGVWSGTSDALHHYFTRQDIHEETITGFGIGDSRGLDAPQLFKFWLISI